ncbi:Rad3-like DNA helicase [Gottschalkia purinilytica]|uniref:Rad3-like DNA helicase n=1 Tax=Gottschalkia purinilytica TaxID=1503 RepID=A0A0L0W8F9_GOTPU|nr:ATP-dependent DNA helicase [Gottschalkia purinilytica]KNF07858.1 Rad3-like DNA helicase [Gottschalkia purinilytica]
MLSENTIKISVRNLVEFVLRSGDLNVRFMSANRALEGTKAHQKVQKNAGENYKSEVHLSYALEYGGFVFIVEGRADGIVHIDDKVLIDEIKSTTRPLESIDENYNSLHWAQAKCYGYIYGRQNNLKEISIQLTYFNIDTEEVKYLEKEFKIDELELFFYDLVDKYVVWANLTNEISKKRDESIRALTFPFESYRKGQRELAISVYKTILDKKKLFVQAPTGIGKTISTIFPTVKAIGEGITSKIFYLTAKTIARQVAEEAFNVMTKKGLYIKTITLTAKEKICFKDETICNPENCEYAKGHFNRVNEAVLDVLKSENIITRDIVEIYARKYKVCPFEFSLDLSLWTDCIICDYNYAFDPRASLKRFFEEESEGYTFLIDECHNLVDRARDMFSAELNKKKFLEMRNIFKNIDLNIYKSLSKINSFMNQTRKKCEDKGYFIDSEEELELYPLLRMFIIRAEEWIINNEQEDGHKELLELYFEVMSFLRISELYDDKFVTYGEKEDRDVRIKLFCLDPSCLLEETMKKVRSTILFSATLTPLKYFRYILGGNDEDYTIKLASPFAKDNLCIAIVNNISTRYTDRDKTYDIIIEYIKLIISQKLGNYFVFFPSYKYMKEVYMRFTEKYPSINCVYQDFNMKENEKEDFINMFEENPKNELVAFVVLGGIFSEGIDLKGNKLIGSIIIGVGLPQICLERNIIREYFNSKNNMGYEYAYMYPGMNKVLQGAGRVIRSERDKGIIILIDDRFSQSKYRSLFPNEWTHNVTIKSPYHAEHLIDKFWKENSCEK